MNEQELEDKKLVYNYLKEFANPLPYKLKDIDLSIEYGKDHIEAKYKQLNTEHQTYDVKATIALFKDKVLISIYEKHVHFDHNTNTMISKKRYQTGGFETLNDVITMYNETTNVETHKKKNRAGKKDVNISVNEREYIFDDGKIDFLHNFKNLKEYYHQNKAHVKRI